MTPPTRNRLCGLTVVYALSGCGPSVSVEPEPNELTDEDAAAIERHAAAFCSAERSCCEGVYYPSEEACTADVIAVLTEASTTEFSTFDRVCLDQVTEAYEADPCSVESPMVSCLPVAIDRGVGEPCTVVRVRTVDVPLCAEGLRCYDGTCQAQAPPQSSPEIGVGERTSPDRAGTSTTSTAPATAFVRRRSAPASRARSGSATAARTGTFRARSSDTPAQTSGPADAASASRSRIWASAASRSPSPGAPTWTTSFPRTAPSIPRPASRGCRLGSARPCVSRTRLRSSALQGSETAASGEEQDRV